MSDGADFSELLYRVRRGDADAACEVVSRYESAIRIAVRTRLSDPRLRRQFDSMDVCQSVLASFFVHAADGAYDLHEPPQLLALFVKMAQNKLAMRARSQYRQRRDTRRLSRVSIDNTGIACSQPGPLREAQGKEMLARVLDAMSPEVRVIAARRMLGDTWPAIASTLGGTAEARRKQFERAVDTIAQSLDVDALEG